MRAHRKAGAFARRHKKHLIAAHAAAVAGLVAAFLAGAFAGPAVKTMFGQRLDKTGQRIYQKIAARKPEHGQAETHLSPATVARLNAANARAARALHPRPLAATEPVTRVDLVRNYSHRPAGTRPMLLVVHDTESPNAPGLQDVYAIAAWFNNPAAQASANYTTDADGNTLLLVPDTEKAWHVAYFNSWAVGDELIGYATQRAWPLPQLQAVAKIFAHEAIRWGIPVQRGAVNGCTIVRAGILEHADLGWCGGGHHDAGPAFPLSRFVGMVAAYRRAELQAETPAAAVAKLRARTGYWSWLAWTLGADAWHPYGRHNPKVRPHVPARIPASWWRARARHIAAAHR